MTDTAMRFHIKDDNLFSLYVDDKLVAIISRDISFKDYIELLAKFGLRLRVVAIK